MHKFWSWLGLNLGKHWIVVLTIGAVLTVGLGYGITKLEFSTGQDSYLNKSDQVYKDNVAYQNLFGGQAMLTLVTMDKGHTVSELFTPENIRQLQAVEKQLRGQRAHRQRRQPAHRARVRRRARPQPVGRPDPERRGQDPARRGRAGEDAGRPGGPQRRRGADADAAQRDPAGAASARQPEVRRLPALRQPGQDPQAAARVLPRRPPRPDGHAARREPVDQGRGRRRRLRHERHGQAPASRTRTITTTGAPVLLKNINDYLTGGMPTLGAIADRRSWR